MSRKILENMYSGRRESVNFKGGTRLMYGKDGGKKEGNSDGK
jgi:hypothetical protein